MKQAIRLTRKDGQVVDAEWVDVSSAHVFDASPGADLVPKHHRCLYAKQLAARDYQTDTPSVELAGYEEEAYIVVAERGQTLTDETYDKALRWLLGIS